MTKESLRARVFADLSAAGFHPAGSLPFPDMDARLRKPEEIAARVMALDALFTWVAFSEKDAASERVVQYIERNGLRDWLTPDEARGQHRLETGEHVGAGVGTWFRARARS